MKGRFRINIFPPAGWENPEENPATSNGERIKCSDTTEGCDININLETKLHMPNLAEPVPPETSPPPKPPQNEVCKRCVTDDASLASPL